MTGPRDWNPPGYWDEAPTSNESISRTTQVSLPRGSAKSGLYSLLSIALGLFACWLPLSLPAANTGSRGWAVTTIGLTAVSVAVAAARSRARQGKSAGVLTVLGSALGILGTVLCLWSAAAFTWSSVPAAPTFNSLTGVSVPIAGAPGVAAPTATPATPATRIVAPLAGADVVAPPLQLRANVRHVAFGLCMGVRSSVQFEKQYGSSFGGLPMSLEVGPDGTVTAGTTTYSKLPADMKLDYLATPEGTYSLMVRDTLSGIGVGCQSGGDQVIEQ